MKYANIITGDIVDREMPTTIVVNGSPTVGVKFSYWQSKGWRVVQTIDDPTEGCRVLTYAPKEIDDTYCKLVVETEKNLAEEEAELVVLHEEDAPEGALANYTKKEKLVIKALLKLAEHHYTPTQARTFLRNIWDSLR